MDQIADNYRAGLDRGPVNLRAAVEGWGSDEVERSRLNTDRRVVVARDQGAALSGGPGLGGDGGVTRLPAGFKIGRSSRTVVASRKQGE